MQDLQTLVDKLFLIVSIVGTLFVLTEMVLRYFRKSICSTVGCKLVASYTRFGDISILLIGFLIFSLLIALTIMSSYFNKTAFGERTISSLSGPAISSSLVSQVGRDAARIRQCVNGFGKVGVTSGQIHHIQDLVKNLYLE